MLKPRASLLVVASLVLAAGSVSAQRKNDPFRIPPQEFASRVKVVAVRPMWLPDSVTNKIVVSRAFDSLLVAELTKHGYRVVASSDVDTLWRRLSDSLQAERDSAIAGRDTARLAALDRVRMNAIATAFHADAVVASSLGFTIALYAGQLARWDGATQGSSTSGAYVSSILGGGGGTAEIPALSLRVTVEDTSGSVLYDHRGGVGVLAKRVVGGAGGVLLGRGKFVRIPVDSAVVDPERNAQAVRVALHPLSPAEIARLAKKKK